MPHRGRGEDSAPTRCADRLQLTALAAGRRQRSEVEDPQPSVLPALDGEPAPSSAGDVEPRSVSPLFSSASFVGVQLPTSRDASGASRSVESPQYVFPSKKPLPVATSRSPVAGSRTAPARPQIAESLSGQVLGTSSPARSEQSEFQTCSSLPLAASITAT